MAKFIYRKLAGSAHGHRVEIQAQDGEELSPEQALVVVLDMIDDHLLQIENERRGLG